MSADEIQILGEAFRKARDAGDDVNARKFAEALIQAQEGSTPPPAAPVAQPQEASAQPADNGGIMNSVKNAMVGNITLGKAMAQGIPGVGPWSDELAGQVLAKLHGGDPEQWRQSYMAPVEAMPAGRRTAAELAGGVVGGAGLAALAPATVGSIPAAIGTAAALSAAEMPGRRNESFDVSKAPVDAALGAAGGVAGLAGAKILSLVGNRVLGRIMGNPFAVRGGKGAREALKESFATAARRGEPAVTTGAPLFAQPAGTAAADAVRALKGEPAAELAGAARAVMKDRSATQEVGQLYQDVLGIPAMSSTTSPQEVAKAGNVLTQDIIDLLGKVKVGGATYKAGKGDANVLRAMRRNASDPAFQNIPEANLARLHDAKTQLSEMARRASEKGSVAKANGIMRSHQKLGDALAAAYPLVPAVPGISTEIPGYGEIAAKYAAAAQAQAARAAAAKLAGGATKFTPLQAGAIPGVGQLAAESVYGSPQGVAIRGAFNVAALLAKLFGKGLSDRQAKVLTGVLTEKDPKKIAAALKAMGIDMSGRPYRAGLVFQGPNIGAGLTREQR